jgi:Fe-S-cluster-containing dehydrogenase component
MDISRRSLSRRSLLKGAAAAGATVALTGRAEAAVSAVSAHAKHERPDAIGMLYDSTLCIGCRACVTKCKEANHLPYDRSNGAIYDAPSDLSHTTKNIIKVATSGDKSAFMKQQCMHCVEPSCVSVCMMGALHKEGEGTRKIAGERKGTGVVLYDKDTCVGCRYCQIACAYVVPRFEWKEAFPLIVKCELCRHRADPAQDGPLAVANPACCEVCPREAVIYGRREELLAEAKRRIAANPQRYNGRVFGEKDGGGTQVLYLAAAGMTFEELGLPKLPEESSASFSEGVSHAPYLHGITPIALYAAAAFVIRRNKRKEEAEHHEEGKR